MGSNPPGWAGLGVAAPYSHTPGKAAQRLLKATAAGGTRKGESGGLPPVAGLAYTTANPWDGALPVRKPDQQRRSGRLQPLDPSCRNPSPQRSQLQELSRDLPGSDQAGSGAIHAKCRAAVTPHPLGSGASGQLPVNGLARGLPHIPRGSRRAVTLGWSGPYPWSRSGSRNRRAQGSMAAQTTCSRRGSGGGDRGMADESKWRRHAAPGEGA